MDKLLHCYEAEGTGWFDFASVVVVVVVVDIAVDDWVHCCSILSRVRLRLMVTNHSVDGKLTRLL